MRNIKIIFTDLDGTLTYAPGKIDDSNKKIFEKLASIGIPVVINTGRSLPYTIALCKQFSTSNYVIADNGASVYNYVSKNMIYRSVINKESLEYMDSLVEKYHLLFVANGIEKRYSNKTEDNIGYSYKERLSDITEEEISQVVIESYSKEDMMYFRKDLLENTTLQIANKTKHVLEGKLLFYDITNNDVSKGKAIEKLCDYLNINVERAMAIGDSTNDIDMLETVGYKVAVANASDEVKDISNYLTLSNKQNGVGIILNEVYSKINE